MADVKVSAMTAASALAGADLVMVAQGGTSKKATCTQVQTFAVSGLSALATSGSGADLTAASVTLAKIATQADKTILGNVSGGAAVPVALTAAQVNQILASATSTWAARGSGTVVGEIKIITDLGPTQGVRMVWDGTYWRVLAPTILVYNSTLATSGTLDTNEQILRQITLPAGLLRAGRIGIIRCAFAKNGTTDAMTAAKLRLGTAGTTSDTAIMSSSTFTSGNRVLPTETWFELSAATTVKYLGNPSGSFGYTGALSATLVTNTATISDVDANALILSATTTMGGATNAGQIGSLFIEMLP